MYIINIVLCNLATKLIIGYTISDALWATMGECVRRMFDHVVTCGNQCGNDE